MGIEPTSARLCVYTAGCGSAFCSPPPEPFGLRWPSKSNLKVNPGVFPGDRTVATVALINLHVNAPGEFVWQIRPAQKKVACCSSCVQITYR